MIGAHIRITISSKGLRDIVDTLKWKEASKEATQSGQLAPQLIENHRDTIVADGIMVRFEVDDGVCPSFDRA